MKIAYESHVNKFNGMEDQIWEVKVTLIWLKVFITWKKTILLGHPTWPGKRQSRLPPTAGPSWRPKTKWNTLHILSLTEIFTLYGLAWSEQIKTDRISSLSSFCQLVSLRESTECSRRGYIIRRSFAYLGIQWMNNAISSSPTNIKYPIWNL